MTDLASLSSLDDPVRRRLYEVVRERAEPVGRDEAAAAAGVGRALAVYHLDKLVEAGLLTASYQRPPGRSGPGAGRPAKLYMRSDREFAVTVPPREYELAARLLVQAVEADPSGNSRAALLKAARRLGAELGSLFRPGVAGLDGALAGHGYEPRRGEDGVIRLRNCPFHQLAEHHREVVCGMNLGLIEGILAGLGAEGLRPVLDPQPGHCCVTIGADQP
ncbi:MAG TPA: helix-turn-helix domain-containing protein [Streptosporangiaceae bacterium]|nr:helix-turn-helix domain-containing protein [Streptosporangiaceae bacterium]